MYKRQEILISEVYEIFGDVDLDIGNIDFNGDVRITGNVISGIVINAKGNISIQGYVGAAIIRSEKDIILSAGVNANGGGLIEAKGDISGSFFENAKVRAGGNVRANYIYNSEVVAAGQVIAEGKRAAIIGGDVTGIMGIIARRCGNESNILTNVRVGATKTSKKQYADVLMRIKEIDSQVDMFEDAIKKMVKADEEGIMPLDRKMYAKLFQAKVVKSAERTKFEEERKRLFELIRESRSSAVYISDYLYPGVKIFIETLFYEPKKKQMEVYIRMLNDEIVMRDYRGCYNPVDLDKV